MRIDQFLWKTRYFKTRSISSKACKNGNVKIEGKSVKPSREVFPNDNIILRKNQVNYHIEIIDIPAKRVGSKIVNLYVLDKTPKEELINKKINSLSISYYNSKNEGRPTKKDKRAIGDFLENKES